VAAAAEPMSTVKVNVQGRHMAVTPAIKEYAEAKVSKVRHLPAAPSFGFRARSAHLTPCA
jgi:hypothetical protein